MEERKCDCRTSHNCFFHESDGGYNWAIQFEGKVFEVYAYEYGVSDKAFAVKLETNIPCANEIKHITVMINPDNGGKPVDSNNIKDWKKMPVITLSGYVKFNFKNIKR